MKVATLPNCPSGIPSVIAVPIDGEEVVIGERANDASETSFLKLRNWKMLLGKSGAELQKAIADNSELTELHSKTTLRDSALRYFRKMLQVTLENAPEVNDKPQVIMGIPPISSENQRDWRQNYRRQIEQIFEELGYPKPKFWPEPFAVFQYHLNQGEIQDLGQQQNVLVVDIGGGTTDICFIQTTVHGRLARGGLNHVPHGVKSVEYGGATLDFFLAKELQLDTSLSVVQQTIKLAKEQLSKDSTELSNSNLAQHKILELADQTVEISNELVQKVFKDKIWPTVRATVLESLEEVREKELKLETVHIVILAGGTCQMGFVQELFKDTLSEFPEFRGSKFIVSPNYEHAVSHGLAIEAAANSRHHGMKPTRVNAYLQEDLKFECGHRRNELYLPRNLKSKSNTQGDLKNGVLLSAPQELDSAVNNEKTWGFKLAQDSNELFYRFSKVSGPNREEVLSDHWQRIARYRKRRPKRHLDLSMNLKDDGFAEFVVTTSDDVIFDLKPPVDLHALSGLEGETFFAVDFGTDNTQIAYVNVKDEALLQPLPTNYSWDTRVKVRSTQLIERLENILGSHADRDVAIEQLNKKILVDYVHHSNWIEGSELERGHTQQIIESSSDSPTPNVRSDFEEFGKWGMIREDGGIQSGKFIKDCRAAENLKHAFHFVANSSKDSERPLSKQMIRELHQLTMRGDNDASPGAFRSRDVEIAGTTFVPPDHIQVEQMCEDMIERFRSNQFIELNPVMQAVEAHVRFVSIHPFTDGNGRVARLLANYFMWRKNLPGFLLSHQNRERYYDALEECNSKESALEGNLTDLTNLFCDVLDALVEKLESEEQVDEESIEPAPVLDELQTDSEFGKVIQRLTKKHPAMVPLNMAEQFEHWYNSMVAMISELKELSAQLSRALRASRSGEVSVKEFPLIDKDTYLAIRERKSFDRTWCFRIVIEFPDYEEEELVFHFGPNSKHAEELKTELASTCSLHVSRLVPEELRHVRVEEQDWSRVIEITHDGSKLGVILRNKSNGTYTYESNKYALVKNWFGLLIHDILDLRSER